MEDTYNDCSVPKPRPSFKIHPKIVEDPEFQADIKLKLDEWTAVKEKHIFNTVDWWEAMVKPAIKQIAVNFTKKYKKSRYGTLNMLYIKQTYFTYVNIPLVCVLFLAS